MARPILHRYRDPVELVWLRCARCLGWRVERSSEVFAAYDGAGTLTLGEDATLDPDDSLAQLIFHEICHALVAGPGALERPDFGLENTDARDVLAEHACHRLQASLADAHGLRDFLAVTTDFRPYWDALPIDPLGPGEDPAIPVAREAAIRARQSPWSEAVQAALAATAQIARALGEVEDDELWSTVRGLHASGYVLHDDTSLHCGDCAWAYPHGGGLRCRQTRRDARNPGARVAPEQPACVRHEPRFEPEICRQCGACCREAFHRVELSRGDQVKKRHPELVVVDGWGAHLPRPDGRCVALDGQGTAREPFHCRIYEERPRNCRQLEIASDACLDARRRVGLSP